VLFKKNSFPSYGKREKKEKEAFLFITGTLTRKFGEETSSTSTGQKKVQTFYTKERERGYTLNR